MGWLKVTTLFSPTHVHMYSLSRKEAMAVQRVFMKQIYLPTSADLRMTSKWGEGEARLSATFS